MSFFGVSFVSTTDDDLEETSTDDSIGHEETTHLATGFYAKSGSCHVWQFIIEKYIYMDTNRYREGGKSMWRLFLIWLLPWRNDKSPPRSSRAFSFKSFDAVFIASKDDASRRIVRERVIERTLSVVIKSAKEDQRKREITHTHISSIQFQTHVGSFLSLWESTRRMPDGLI